MKIVRANFRSKLKMKQHFGKAMAIFYWMTIWPSNDIGLSKSKLFFTLKCWNNYFERKYKDYLINEYTLR